MNFPFSNAVDDKYIENAINKILAQFDEEFIGKKVTMEQIDHMAALIATSIILTSIKSAHITQKTNIAHDLQYMTTDTIARIVHAMQKVTTDKYDILKGSNIS